MCTQKELNRQYNKIKIVSIMWNSFVPLFLKVVQKEKKIQLNMYSHKAFIEAEGKELAQEIEEKFKQAQIILLYITEDPFWERIKEILNKITGKVKVISISSDPIRWGQFATEGVEICAKAYEYISLGGEENFLELLKFLAHLVDKEIAFKPPKEVPWEGIISIEDGEIFTSREEYWMKHPRGKRPVVGLLLSRAILNLVDKDVEAKLISSLKKEGLSPLPVFSHWTSAPEVGAKGPLEACKNFFLDSAERPIISALINLQYFLLGSQEKNDGSSSAVTLFKKLNVPVFKPVISYSLSKKEWEESPVGLTSDITFGIALPEFEGNIEPIIIGCTRKSQVDYPYGEEETREALEERISLVANRIANWIRMLSLDTSERKIAIIIHKNECAGLEATLGSAAGLDSGESIITLCKKLKKTGYKISKLPSSGEELFKLILEKKAISEFRWTTVEEIVDRGGALYLMPEDVYRRHFSSLPEKAKKQIVKAWGEPPGKEVNGVPPAMLYNNNIVITGINFGNVVVMMQPKRGCAGSRCDGKVCKILHDPDVPPPHQYIATYFYIEKIFRAHAIIHVGTHGNLEWLPGKGAGLSAWCWPDIAIGVLPHLYIYNSDNPAEGIVAKRRSYATIVNHMQASMSTSGTYGTLQKLDELMGEYERAKDRDKARAHRLKHKILEDALRSHILEEEPKNKEFKWVLEQIHSTLSRIRNSQTRNSMHIFGTIPSLERCANIIKSILRFDLKRDTNILKFFFETWEEDIYEALAYPFKRSKGGELYGRLLQRAEEESLKAIISVIKGEDLLPILQERRKKFDPIKKLILEIYNRILASREIDSIKKALEGGFVEPGPSGFISRGRYDILPTGRNMYNIDPSRVPTPAAYEVGVRLADSLLEKYKKEHHRYPEKIGMVWMASDIMRSEGEQLAQMLHLLGARPRWRENGEIDGFEIIPLEEINRPRIDIHVRVSGILRDSFPNLISYLDEVICAIALLDEPEDKNFIKFHINKTAQELSLDPSKKENLRKLSYRIFCAQPGVYRAGVNLAIYASAWKEKKDLAEVYVYWNGYAYGGKPTGKDFGVPAHRELMKSLESVKVTFDKHISDETDFLHCCGFFSNYGGMTLAVEHLSGKKPSTYYGDTREPSNIGVVDFSEEIKRIVKAKLLNPIYIEGMKQHGYRGASDISKKIGRLYGFAATTEEVRDWIFEEISETFLFNEEMRKWFKEVNPWAMEEVMRRLLEAASRGIWKAKKQTMEQLRQLYLELEGVLEDSLSSTHQEFQGGNVDIFSPEEVNEWRSKLTSILGGD